MQKPNWQYVYVLILFPCLIYTVPYTARAIWLDYTAVPMWDSWRSVQYLDQLLRFEPGHFWVQHNEHRIVFPEMVYALDYIFLRGEQLLPIAFNVACQLAQLALLWRLVARMKDMPLAFRLALGAGCGLFMTCAMQVQGILGTFELQWYLSQLAAALAFVFLWQSARTGRWSSLALSIGAAVLATYTTGNGVALWPVLTMAAVLLGLPRPRIASVAMAGILSIAAYFVGYTFMSQGRTALLLAHPLYAIWFMGVFLATPVSYVSVRLGGLAGLGGLLLVALAVALAIRLRKSREPALVVTAGVCFYIACSALMFAYGRMDPGDPAVAAALAARYVSLPLTFCANLCVAIGWLIMRLDRGRPRALTLWLHMGAAAMTLVILAAVIGRQKVYEKAFASQQARANESGIALVAGLEDPDSIRTIFPDPPFVLKRLAAIRQRRLSIFAAGRQDWMGQPIGRVFQAGSPNLCSGALETLAAVTGGYRATGWAWDRQAGRPPHDTVLTNSAGIMVGFGETRPGGYAEDSHWAGFARFAGIRGTIQAYAIVRGGMACALAPPRQAPPVTILTPSLVGARIPIAAWQADPAWTRNGFHASVGTLSGEILYGSYSGSDALRGVLTSAPFETGGRDCIALPVAHGPSLGGQSIRLVEAESGQTVASIPLNETPGIWQFWPVALPGVARLRIIAEDNGSQWGQWVGVGEPHWCQP